MPRCHADMILSRVAYYNSTEPFLGHWYDQLSCSATLQMKTTSENIVPNE